jgi:hypothetical protein
MAIGENKGRKSRRSALVVYNGCKQSRSRDGEFRKVRTWALSGDALSCNAPYASTEMNTPSPKCSIENEEWRERNRSQGGEKQGWTGPGRTTMELWSWSGCLAPPSPPCLR